MMTSNNGDVSKSPATPSSSAIFQSNEKPVWESQQIMQGHREVLIKHGTEMYRLLLTKANKLILQK